MKKRRSFYIEDEYYKAIEEYAKKEDLSVSHIMNKILKEKFKEEVK